MAKLAAGIYGGALFALAAERDAAGLYEEEAACVLAALRENPEMEKLLSHPKISKEEKAAVVEAVFKGRLSADITGFLVVLVQKGRGAEIIAALQDFLIKMKEHKKIGTAYVASAVELHAGQKAELENKLIASTDYKQIEIEYLVDPSLIGGMVIRMNGRVVDNSIRTKLHLLSRKLSKVQLTENS